MEQLGSRWTDFHEIWYVRICQKSVEKIQVQLRPDKNKGYFTWRPIYIFIISRPFLLTMSYVSDKSCRGNQNTHFVFSDFFFENLAVYDGKILYSRAGHLRQYGACASYAGYLRLQIQHKSGCVTLTAFPLQQWLHEHASVLRYTFIDVLALIFRFPVRTRGLNGWSMKWSLFSVQCRH